jgi:hypothetical protein
MGCLLDRLKAGSTAYTVESTGEGGFVLFCREGHADEFTILVRDLVSRFPSEFVILPTSNGSNGYERAVVLPF